MTALGPETADYLVRTVLNESAPRTDRLFAFGLLLQEGPANRRALERIAADCVDPFIGRVARLQVARAEATAEVRLVQAMGR